MKKGWLLFWGMAAFLSAGWLQAAGSFEGEVDMKMSSGKSDKDIVMQYYVKGTKIRTQTTSSDGKSSGGAIMDFKTRELIAIMDQQKMYTVSHIKPGAFQEKDHNFKFHKTGNTATILGRGCQEWDYESDDGQGKIWFASGMGNWWANSMSAQADQLSPSQKAILSMVLSKNLFPMKWEATNKDGSTKYSSEVVKVEKKSLSSGLFEPPAGYKKMQMPDFGDMSSGKMSKEDMMKMLEQYKKQ